MQKKKKRSEDKKREATRKKNTTDHPHRLPAVETVQAGSRVMQIDYKILPAAWRSVAFAGSDGFFCLPGTVGSREDPDELVRILAGQ